MKIQVTPAMMQRAMDTMSTEFQKFAGDACENCVILSVKGLRVQMSSTIEHEILMGLFRDILVADDIRKAKN